MPTLKAHLVRGNKKTPAGTQEFYKMNKLR